MKVWRGITLTTWIIILASCAFFALEYHAFATTALDSTKVKHWLADSTAYETVRDTYLVSQVQDAIATKIPSNKLFDTSLLSDVLAETLPKPTLVAQFGPVIDSTYRWLDSKEPSIHFSIPLGDKKDQFYRSLEVKLGKKIASFTKCSTYQYPPEEALFSMACLPRYVTAGEATQAVMGYLRAGDFPLGDAITEDNVMLPAGQTDMLKQLPTYLNIGWVLNLIAIVVFCFVTLLVLITRKSLGAIAVGISLALAGIAAMLVAPVIMSFSVPSGGGLASVLSAVTSTIAPKVAAASTQGAILSFLVGIVAIAGASAWRWQRGRRG